MADGNGHDSESERWSAQAEAHDRTTAVEHRLDFVMRELRELRADMNSQFKKASDASDVTSAKLDGINSALDRLLKNSIPNEPTAEARPLPKPIPIRRRR